MEFTNKVILISGATGGMAKEIARQLSKEKCKFALFARRENVLEELSKELIKNGSECIFKKCDVTNKDDVKKAVKFTIEKFGKIDIALLTAGILKPNPIQTFDSSIIKRSMDINFMGMVLFIEQLLPVMKKQKSGIIAATSTLPDKRGVPGWGAYGASKAALSWLVESLRAEAKQLYDIDFITIKPGSVETPMIETYDRKGSVSAEKAAYFIINGIKKKKKIIQFPKYQVIPIRFLDLLPPFAYDEMDIEEQKGEGYPEVKEE